MSSLCLPAPQALHLGRSTGLILSHGSLGVGTDGDPDPCCHCSPSPPLTSTLMPTDPCPLPTIKMLLPDADTGLMGTAPVWRGHSPSVRGHSPSVEWHRAGMEQAQSWCGRGVAPVWRIFKVPKKTLRFENIQGPMGGPVFDGRSAPSPAPSLSQPEDTLPADGHSSCRWTLGITEIKASSPLREQCWAPTAGRTEKTVRGVGSKATKRTKQP